jgi:hypothetical protein
MVYRFIFDLVSYLCCGVLVVKRDDENIKFIGYRRVVSYHRICSIATICECTMNEVEHRDRCGKLG